MAVLIGVVLMWSVVSCTLPRAGAGSSLSDPVGARLDPIGVLVAIASDRPTRSFDIKQSEHPDVIPSVIAAEAGTRSALLGEAGDVRFPPSSIATWRLIDSVVRRGPPRTFAT
jgi:hypothetical protein